MSNTPKLNFRTSLWISVIVFMLFTGYVWFLTFFVEPLTGMEDTERATRSFEMLSVVLGLLAGGCMAGYFSFDYSKVGAQHKPVALLISWLFICSIYLLLALIMYALRRAGALAIIDSWARALLFLASFAFFDGLLLFERWKLGQFKETE